MDTNSELRFSRPTDDTLLIHFSGAWKLANKLPSSDEVREQVVKEPGIQRVTFDTKELKGWDSGFLIFYKKIVDVCTQNNINIEQDGLPDGVQRLLHLAAAVPERKGARREKARVPFLEQVADTSIGAWRSLIDMLNFIGEATVAFGRVLRGKACFRTSDMFLTMQECGAQALPIVSLISLLVGLILAFIGAIQLKILGRRSMSPASLVSGWSGHSRQL